MRLLFGTILVIGGLSGAAIGAMSEVVVNSPLFIFDGLELGLSLALFSAVAFLSGLYHLFLAS